MMGSFEVALAFWLKEASFIIVVISLLVVRAQQVRKPDGNNKNGQMKEVFHFVA
jgi:hypothetical protein